MTEVLKNSTTRWAMGRSVPLPTTAVPRAKPRAVNSEQRERDIGGVGSTGCQFSDTFQLHVSCNKASNDHGGAVGSGDLGVYRGLFGLLGVTLCGRFMVAV